MVYGSNAGICFSFCSQRVGHNSHMDGQEFNNRMYVYSETAGKAVNKCGSSEAEGGGICFGVCQYEE